MTQEVKIKEGEIAVLDTEAVYSGGTNVREERLVRKALGLPVTKELVFYKDKRDVNSKVPVTTYRITEMYEITDRWYTIEITCGDGYVTSIHSGYLKQMQDPNFVEEMLEQELAATD